MDVEKEVKPGSDLYEGPKYWKDTSSDIWLKIAVAILIIALVCMAASVPIVFF